MLLERVAVRADGQPVLLPNESQQALLEQVCRTEHGLRPETARRWFVDAG